MPRRRSTPSRTSSTAAATSRRWPSERSDDPSKALKGLLGWVEATDGQYGEYFKAAAKADAGDVIGPIKDDTGWYLLKVDDRQAAGRDPILDDFLAGGRRLR